MSDTIESHNCPHCNRPHVQERIYKHRVSPLVAGALIKFIQAVRYYGRNNIHIREDMADRQGAPFQLNKDEWTNFSKLRFHALVAHADRDSKRSGNWVLTTRGALFLKGERIPLYAHTLDNHVIEHSGPMVTISEVLGGSREYLEKIPEFDVQRPERTQGEGARQQTLNS